MILLAEVFQMGDESKNTWYCRLLKGPLTLVSDGEYGVESDSPEGAKKAMKKRLKVDGASKGNVISFKVYKGSRHIWVGRAVLDKEDPTHLWYVIRREGTWWVCYSSWWRTPDERICLEKKFKKEHLIPANELVFFTNNGFLTKDEMKEDAIDGPQKRIVDNNLFSRGSNESN